MKLSAKHTNSLTIITLQETRLDAFVTPEFKQQMEQIIHKGHTHIILDISQLNFMDSSSLCSMVDVLKGLGNQGKMVVVGAQGVVMDLFKNTHMDKIFILEDTIEAAKDKFMAAEPALA